MKLTNLTLLTYKLYENFKTSCWGVLHIWRLCCNMFCKKQSAVILINMKQTNLLLKNWLRLHSSSGPSLEKSTPALLLVSKIVKTRAGVHANTPAPVHLWAALNGWSIDGAHRYVTEHGQDWIYCRILAIFLDQNWIWIFIFEKKMVQDRIKIFVWFLLRKFSDSDSRCHKWCCCCFLCCYSYSQKIKMVLSVCAAFITIDDNSCNFIVNIFRQSGSSKLLLYCWYGALLVVLSGICVCSIG